VAPTPHLCVSDIWHTDVFWKFCLIQKHVNRLAHFHTCIVIVCKSDIGTLVMHVGLTCVRKD